MAERMVEANGVELCTEPFGNPADPPILLINGQQVHGGPGNDLVIGGEKDSQDFLSGHQGDDILKGLGGNDQLDTFATHSGKQGLWRRWGRRADRRRR